MLKFVVGRLLAMVPVLAIVALLVFLLLYLTPGDPAAVMAGDHATPEEIERIRAQLGLNEPLAKQFALWLGRLLIGDLGTSIFSGLPVGTLIAQRVEPTLSLSLTTLVLALPIAITTGVLAAAFAGRLV